MNSIDFRCKQMEFKAERSLIKAKYENLVIAARGRYQQDLNRLENEKNKELMEIARKEDDMIRRYRELKEAAQLPESC